MSRFDFSTFDKFYARWCELHSWYKHGSWYGVLHKSESVKTCNDKKTCGLRDYYCDHKAGTKDFWEFISVERLEELKTLPSNYHNYINIRAQANAWQNQVYLKHRFKVSPFVFRNQKDKNSFMSRSMVNYFYDTYCYKTITSTNRYPKLLKRLSKAEKSKSKSVSKEVIDKICQLEWNYLRRKSLQVCINIWKDLVKIYHDKIIEIEMIPADIATIIGNYCCDLPFDPFLAPTTDIPYVFQ